MEELITITPELATLWLQKNNRNRRVKQHKVQMIARDIKSGRWQSTNPNPISFYQDGFLADGQHRLLAIVSAGISIQCRVVYDVANNAGVYIDTNVARSVSDTVTVFIGDEQYVPKITTMVKWSFVNGEELTPQQHLDLYVQYKDDLLFILDSFKGSNRCLQSGFILSALFMALVGGVNNETITQFCEVLKTGVTVEDRDVTVIAFRDYVFQNKVPGTRDGRLDLLIRAQNAICNYANNKIAKRTYKGTSFRYPRIPVM